MILKTQAIKVLLGATAATLLIASCVEIPSEGHTPPDYKSSIRVMYLDPAIAASASIAVASGPDFATFATDVFAPGSFGDVTAYTTIDAGGKQMFLSPGDADTTALPFATDLRGTLLVLPRPDVSMDRFLLAGEGLTFDPIGVDGSSQVRVVNAIARGASDTVDVAVDVYQVSDSSTVVTGLAFGAFSSYLLVDAGSTEAFYLTRAGTTEVLTAAAISITGASNTAYTLVASGSADAVVFQDYRNE